MSDKVEIRFKSVNETEREETIKRLVFFAKEMQELRDYITKIHLSGKIELEPDKFFELFDPLNCKIRDARLGSSLYTRYFTDVDGVSFSCLTRIADGVFKPGEP